MLAETFTAPNVVNTTTSSVVVEVLRLFENPSVTAIPTKNYKC